MPAVFVHGVPDTHRVWDDLIPLLHRRDIVTLTLPGFGCPIPRGFGATKDEYADWLVRELRAFGEPVDLVGHDWGALLVMRAACLAPECIRTWAAGSAPLDPEYVWHDTAQAWQTPEVGEQVMAMITPDLMAPQLEAAGVPAEHARTTAQHVDALMKDCILKLYRSAKTASAEWAPDLARITAPGITFWGELDPFVAPIHGERTAKHANAAFTVLPGCGHWWPLQRPAEVAEALTQHWALLP